MIDFKAASDAFFGLAGWQQAPTGTDVIALSASLTASSSGLTYNRHPYLTSEAIQALAPDFIARISDQTERETAYNNWLTEITKRGIEQAVSNWWTKKVQANTARTLITHRSAFWYDGPVKYGPAPSTRRLGLYVRPFTQLTNMLHFKVSQIGIALSAPQSIDVYILKDGESTPVTQTINYDGNGEEKFYPLDTPFIMSSEGYKGFFVYYNSDDVTGQVITYRGNCNCRMSSRYVGIHGHNGPTTPAAGEFGMRPYVTRENYGLNIKLEGYCDYTDFVISQKDALAPLISLQVADYVLRLMAANPHGRLNRHEGQADPDRILYQVDGDPQGRMTGLAAELAAAYDAAGFDRENADKHCLPCGGNYGISRTPTG